MREYCGINLSNGNFYVGSTTELSRRLQTHESSQRLGDGVVYWLVGEEHEDDNREEEQFYLDFYFRSPGCLNLSGNSLLGNNQGQIWTKERRENAAKAKQGNTNGRGNKGKRHKKRTFNRKLSAPEATYGKRCKSQKQRAETKAGKENILRAGRVGALSRWGGFNGYFPASLEYRTALSSDFVNYFSAYGWW